MLETTQNLLLLFIGNLDTLELNHKYYESRYKTIFTDN